MPLPKPWRLEDVSLERLSLEGIALEWADPETMATLIGLAVALLPLTVAGVMWAMTMPDRSRQGGVALATAWNALWLPVLNLVAVEVGWWSFGATGPAIAGLPLVLWFGWVVLWGVIGPLLRWRPWAAVSLLLLIDLATMGLLAPTVVLGDSWLVGEALALALVGWPGLLLARWSSERSHVRARVLLQVAMFTNLLLWWLPLAAVSATGSRLTLTISPWHLGVVVAALGLGAIPAVTAVADFEANQGSPWPWDWTDRPVLSGPYRYVRSPMQIGAVLLLGADVLLYGDWVIGATAAVALAYSALFCRHEAQDLTDRFGADWAAVALDQRRWWPSWRPHHNSTAAVLWVDLGCGVCSPVANFLSQFDPVALDIRDAREHSDGLTRLRYERGDGATYNGVAGVGAALEHCNLGLAALGWFLRLPVLWRLWQLVGDAVGFGPRPAGSGAQVEVCDPAIATAS